MPFDFGDVVLVPFPFTSQRASKTEAHGPLGEKRQSQYDFETSGMSTCH
jgi:hypothetical protein